MKTHRPILQSKLTKPYTARTLQRTRLKEQLAAITHKKLALIIAGAGYGKSTEIPGAIELLLERMPNTLHLVIISRKEPGLKLSRYRATTDIVERQPIKIQDFMMRSSLLSHLDPEICDIASLYRR